MDKDELKELIEFMNENNLCELEIEQEGKRIKLKKYSSETSFITPQLPSQPSVPGKDADTPPEESNLIEIKSPIVGTFYRAPSPGAKPYVDVGDEINPGDVVCIIEAMKLMNEIKSDVHGKIVKILVENGEAVEYGQPLFQVEPL